MNYLHRVLLVPFTFLALTLTACAERDSLHSSSGHAPAAKQVTSWSAEKVQVRCSSADCPEGVGVLVFVQDNKWGYRIQRCTATAIGADRILTNSHCGKSNTYSRAFFFLPVGGVTRHYDVSVRVYEREDGEGLESGMGTDLAIFSLSERMQGVKPRHLARKIPSEMRTLVAYMVNDPTDQFQNFNVDKSVCSTVARQPLFGGGSEEPHVGLALFGCPTVHGNSGSPLFLPGNLEDVQVVLNSSYPLGTEKAEPLLTRLLSIFAERPASITGNFAMGNRVHCMDVEGQPAAESLCTRLTLRDALRTPFESGTAKIARQRLTELNADSPVLWGLRVFPAKVRARTSGLRGEPLAGQGIVLIPYPICMRSSLPLGESEPSRSVQYLAVGLNEQGKVIGKVQREAPLRTRFSRSSVPGNYEVSYVQDFRMESATDVPTTNYVGEPDDQEAKRMLSPTLPLLIGRCNLENIPVISDKDLSFVPQLKD